MKIGVVKEIKDKESRVALTPTGVRTLVSAGHEVIVQKTAGLGSGFSDQQYSGVGANIVASHEAWAADLVIKVKEPLESEYKYLSPNILFTYLHLAGPSKSLTEALLENKTIAIAYETVEDGQGKLPLLAPMSAIAGNMATLMGSYHLAKFNHGKGVQLGTVLGQKHGKVVIIGDGVVGQHAAKVAASMGARVIILGKHPERESQLKLNVSKDIHFQVSGADVIAHHLEDADLVVGAVLRHGAKAPHIVTENMVKRMQAGSVIVDVSIDQGGCVATSRPTSHSKPVFEKHGVIHYCVTNMPGAYPKTSTIALSEATLPYVLQLANRGIQALRDDAGFGKGLNTYKGYVTYQPVAKALDLIPLFKPFSEMI